MLPLGATSKATGHSDLAAGRMGSDRSSWQHFRPRGSQSHSVPKGWRLTEVRWGAKEERSGLRRIKDSSVPSMRDQKVAKTPKSDRASGGTATIHDQKLDRGEGGELHQTASGKAAVLTTAQGGPVSDDQNSLKIGPRGPTLIEDFHFREKIFHFDHERIPERVVHARGYAAHGFFENYKPLSKYTRADLFQRPAKGRLRSSDFRLSPAARVPSTSRGMSGASR